MAMIRHGTEVSGLWERDKKRLELTEVHFKADNGIYSIRPPTEYM